MFTTSIIIGSLLVLPQTWATVFTTSPTASTTCHGGQTCILAWKEDDNNTPPLLAQWGTADIGIWVGSQQQQTQLQLIQQGVNVASVGQVNFTPDPSIGPNADVYFIRFTSDSTKDPNNPQFPAESFSAKFTLDNMSGQFNSTVQAQIAGASSAPVPGPTPTPASNNSSTAAHTGSTSSTGSGTKSSSTAKPTGATSAAMKLSVRSVGVVGGVAALFALLL